MNFKYVIAALALGLMSGTASADTYTSVNFSGGIFGGNAFYQKNFGVNVTEWRIISQLAIEPGIPASRICQVIGFDKGPVSRNLSALQKRGLLTIRTAPDDGRTHSITLTARGRAIHDKVIVAALERERRLLSCLKKDEREVLIDLLRRLHENLGAVTGQSTT